MVERGVSVLPDGSPVAGPFSFLLLGCFQRYCEGTWIPGLRRRLAAVGFGGISVLIVSPFCWECGLRLGGEDNE